MIPGVVALISATCTCPDRSGRSTRWACALHGLAEKRPKESSPAHQHHKPNHSRTYLRDGKRSPRCASQQQHDDHRRYDHDGRSHQQPSEPQSRHVQLLPIVMVIQPPVPQRALDGDAPHRSL
jgi:hypothetical protein